MDQNPPATAANAGAATAGSPSPPPTAAWRTAELLRSLVRGDELGLAALGAAAGVLVAAVGAAAEALHVLAFTLPPGARLSAWPDVEPWRAALLPAVGGLRGLM